MGLLNFSSVWVRERENSLFFNSEFDQKVKKVSLFISIPLLGRVLFALFLGFFQLLDVDSVVKVKSHLVIPLFLGVGLSFLVFDYRYGSKFWWAFLVLSSSMSWKLGS